LKEKRCVTREEEKGRCGEGGNSPGRQGWFGLWSLGWSSPIGANPTIKPSTEEKETVPNFLQDRKKNPPKRGTPEKAKVNTVNHEGGRKGVKSLADLSVEFL